MKTHRNALLSIAIAAFGFSAEASAQNFSQTRQSYLAIKEYIIREIPKTRVPGDFPRDPAWLGDCGDGVRKYVGHVHPTNSMNFQLASLAYDFLFIRYVLAGLYPDNLWADDLVNFENQQLKRIHERRDTAAPLEKFQKALAARLNLHRKKSSAKLPPVLWMGDECGAGEVRVILIADKARIQFIPRIFYDVCPTRGTGRDIECDWRDYGGGAALLSGRYKVRATFRDGRVATRDMDVDKISESAGGIRRFTIQP